MLVEAAGSGSGDECFLVAAWMVFFVAESDEVSGLLVRFFSSS